MGFIKEREYDIKNPRDADRPCNQPFGELSVMFKTRSDGDKSTAASLQKKAATVLPSPDVSRWDILIIH